MPRRNFDPDDANRLVGELVHMMSMVYLDFDGRDQPLTVTHFLRTVAEKHQRVYPEHYHR
jgi:hypothetical protein